MSTLRESSWFFVERELMGRSRGVVKIPFEGVAVGEDGFFAELGRRGIYESR